MGYTKELADPWGLLLAASAGCVAWAIHLPAVGAIAVGLAILAGRAGLAHLNRDPEGERPEVEVAAHSEEAACLLRASAAENDFAAALDEHRPGPLADRVPALTGSVAAAVDALYRLAGRVTLANRVLAEADTETHARLTAARTRLLSDLEAGTAGLESLVEQAGALRKLTQTSLTALSESVAALRHSLADTEETTRRAVGA
ncbi:hypothetical protein [Actinokineospora pegani]|uniref:hypothetical protein n=1 Tax=Actinokineospora pegani TaxID=2654637 RepID=UPI0012E9D67A|nr:hypothetical protein [Actinokineospora pegani]